jgi:eukaryotic-like serine/threonine-protein kinase
LPAKRRTIVARCKIKNSEILASLNARAMTPERWEKIDRLFHAAIKVELPERPAFLAQACAGDETLRSEVESLLSSHGMDDSFFETPAADVAADLLGAHGSACKPGQQIENYRIVRQLGAGGMGEVYLADDLRLKRNVALKLLPPHYTVNPDRVGRFEREARAASALNHPNIVTIYEIGQANSTHFIATEFVDGKTLRQLINEKPLTLGEALNVVIQVAGALIGAHAARIVHRDIKPENIMIRADGYVKILDFGLAKLNELEITDSDLETPTLLQSNPGLVMGTVQYMSPEQARGKKVDVRTDIWSLGVVLYELLTGRVPFSGETPSHVMVSLMEDELPSLKGYANVLPELDLIVTKALRKNKKERYQTANQLALDLRNLKRDLQLKASLTGSLAAVPATQSGTKRDRRASIVGTADMSVAHSTSSSEYLVDEIKRHKTVVATLALVILLAGAIGLGTWITRGNREQFEGTVLSAPFVSEKLSTNGKVHHAIISPDGKSVVYTNIGSNRKQSIWLRNLDTGGNVEIIAPSDNIYFGLAFAPDGNSFYFVSSPRGVVVSPDIYRVSVSGGVSQKIVGDSQGWISVSADGAKISFVRCPHRADDYCSLWIADSADGRNEKKLVSQPRPFRIGDNEFSPDGKLVAFATGQSNNAANEFRLSAVDVESGAWRDLTTERFFDIGGLAWLPDQKALLFTAGKVPNRNAGIWQVSSATGEVEALTKDSEVYQDLSLDKTASRLVATKFKQDFKLHVRNLENASVSLVMLDAVQVAFAPDGKIVYKSSMSGTDDIWSVNPNGEDQRQLTNDPADDRMPIIPPDNKVIYFASNRTGKVQVWRMHVDGSNQTQVTHAHGGFPLFVSLDGEWLYFTHGIDRTLWRASTRSGEEQIVMNKVKRLFAFSPDGSLVSSEATIGGEKLIVTVSLADGQTVKTFKCPDPGARINEISWLPDGKGLVYVLTNGESDKSTVWLQPFDTGEAPRNIADLGDEPVVESSGLALSPDGKSFAVSQGGWLHDAVLLRGLR